MRICNSGTPSEFLIRLLKKIDILTFVKKERMEEFLLTDLQIIEQPPGSDSLTYGKA